VLDSFLSGSLIGYQWGASYNSELALEDSWLAPEEDSLFRSSLLGSGMSLDSSLALTREYKVDKKIWNSGERNDISKRRAGVCLAQCLPDGT